MLPPGLHLSLRVCKRGEVSIDTHTIAISRSPRLHPDRRRALQSAAEVSAADGAVLGGKGP